MPPITKDNVKQALRARQAADAARLSICRDDVLVGLLDAVEMGWEHQNPGGMVGALREVAKMLGFFAHEVKRVEISAPESGAYQNLARWSDAQLLDAIAAGSSVASAPS